MADRILGLDISDTSVKAVGLDRGLKGYRIGFCAWLPINPEEGLDACLADLFEQMPAFDAAQCHSAFPSHRISYRNLTMPFRDRKKIAQTIAYELEPMLPFSIETLTTDYVLANDGEKTSVLSASIQTEELERFLSTLSAQGLDPDVVEVGAVASAVACVKHSGTSFTQCLFVDVGAYCTTAVFVGKNGVRLVRAFAFGVGPGTPTQNANSKKPEELSPVLDTTGPLFCRELRNTLHAFRYEIMPDAAVDKIVLTGKGALVPTLKEMIAKELELPVEVLDLTRYVTLEFEDGVQDTWNPCLMNSALALALRDPKDADGFNFRTGRFRKAKRYEQLKGEMKRIAVYAAVIVLALGADFFAHYYVLNKQHRQLQDQMVSIFKTALPDVKRIVDPVHQMKVKIKEAKQSTLLPSESLVERAVVDILREIALRIPKTAEVDLGSLLIDEERIRIKGLTDTFNTVDEIKNGLAVSEYLKDVTIASAQLDRKTNKIRFELIMAHQ